MKNASNEQSYLLLDRVEKGSAEELSAMLAAHTYNNWTLAKAWSDAYALSVNLDALKVLSKFVNPKRENSDALVGCARNGHLEAVQFLIPLSDPSNGKARALRSAAKNGHSHIVQALVPYATQEDILIAVSDVASLWSSRQAWNAMRNEAFSGSEIAEPLLYLMRLVGFDAIARSFKQTGAGKKDARHYDEFLRVMLDERSIGAEELAPLFEHADWAEHLVRCRVDWERLSIAKQTRPSSGAVQSKRL